MKKIFIIIVLSLLPVALSANTVYPDASRGDEHYRLGNYDSAIACYQATLQAGLTSAELHYNLGNAYYRDGQLANAILHYRRALRLNPSMADAKQNLALASSHTVDRIPVLPRFFLVSWVDTLSTDVTPAAWRAVWLAIFALLAIAVVVFLRGNSRGLRKTGLVVTIVMALFLVIATWLLLRTTTRYNAHADAVVMPQAVTVKGSPETESVDKLTLHEGTVVTITDSLSGWYKITLADGTTGWCATNHLERI